MTDPWLVYNHCNTTETCQEIVEQTCKLFQNSLLLSQKEGGLANDTWFLAYIFFSLVGLLWITYVFWAYKELNAHPMRMFLYLSIFTATQLMIALFKSQICNFKLPQLLCWTVYFEPATYFNQNRAQNLIKAMILFITSFSFSMTMCLNYCLCIDLHLMIRNPFKQKEARIKYYLSFSVVLSLIHSILFSLNTKNSSKFLLIMGAVTLTVFFFVILTSTIYTYSKLSAPGISGQVRKLVIYRHALTMFFYVLCNFVILFYAMAIFDSGITDTWSFFIFALLYYGQGYPLFAIRFTDPAVYQIFKSQLEQILNFITCRKKQVTIQNEANSDELLINNELQQNLRGSGQKKIVAAAPLYLFLASSFNTELVYLILKGICQFSYLTCNTDGKCTFSNQKASKMTLEKNNDGLTITLNQIKIKNFEQWSQMKTEDLRENKKMIFAKKVEDHLINVTKITDDVEIQHDSKKDILILKQKVKITYHRKDLFKQMFFEFFCSQVQNWHQSLKPRYNRDMIFKAGEGAGRSGSFFFFSHDHKFIIKTMTDSELQLFLSRLPAFVQHHNTNKNSLLAKIMGVFTVQTPNLKVHVMLMENTLQLQDPDSLEYIFDLKGSLVSRRVKGKIKSSTTLKDKNFLEISNSKVKKGQTLVDLTNQDKKKLQVALRKDVEFLRDQGLMDYSLLLAIEEKVNQANTPMNRGQQARISLNTSTLTIENFSQMFTNKHQFKNKKKVYHIAIIDYLQEWNLNKKGERLLKVYFRCKNGLELSAIEPVEYAQRFRSFMERNVIAT